jgi:transposase-like protein
LRQGYRPYRRATPERVAEILALSANGTPIRVIAETVGLSSCTVMRVRRIHRGLPHASWPSDCLGSAD